LRTFIGFCLAGLTAALALLLLRAPLATAPPCGFWPGFCAMTAGSGADGDGPGQRRGLARIRVAMLMDAVSRDFLADVRSISRSSGRSS